MFYDFYFSDGTFLLGRFEESGKRHAKEKGLEITKMVENHRRPFKFHMGNTPPRIKDKFEGGYDFCTGKVFKNEKDREKYLVDNGMELVRKKDMEKPTEQKKKVKFIEGEETLREIKREHNDISDNEIDNVIKPL